MAEQSYNNSLPTDSRPGQLENRNFLSPVGFQFQIGKMPAVEFFCQSAAIPQVSMGIAKQTTRFNVVNQPGDEMYYEPLYVKFLVDENMKNYYQVHDWIRKITTPYSSKEFTFWTGDDGVDDRRPNPYRDREDTDKWVNQWKSDCSLIILSSNYRPVAEFVFRSCFPLSLTTLNFDAAVADLTYFTAEMSMSYDYFDYYIWDAAEATDASMKPTYRKTYLGETFETYESGTNIRHVGG